MSDKCNDCGFNRKYKHSHRTVRMWRIEQIIAGAYINLCTYHAFFYWLKRFKWWLNERSGYRLEKHTPMKKWWIK